MKFARSFLLILLVSMVSMTANAQDDIDQLLQNNVEDAKKLVGAYISPFMKSISLGLNQGWYNTAKPHKIAGVDLTITVSALTIPNKESFYEPAKLGLKSVSLQNSSPNYPYAPTVFGPDKTPTFMTNTGESFDGPGGLGIKDEIGKNIMPVPMAHLGFGLPKNTDLKIRFIPSINLGGDGKLKMFGVGVMHDVKQHIPGIKLFPFDLSAFVGYTRFSLNYAFEGDAASGEGNQRGEFSINSTTIQGLISKQFAVLTLYGGLGYNIAKSGLAVKGTFDLNNDGDTNDLNEKDPLDMKFAASGARATAGFRLKLAVLTLHADYTLQKYKTLTVGLGISVR